MSDAAQRKRDFKPLFTWRSALVESDLEPTTRHVALTLSLHMNERGGSCFPSHATLAVETGLSRSTVIKHVGILEDRGWLSKDQGGGAKSNTYAATVPSSPSGKQTRPGDGLVRETTPPVREDDPTRPGAGHEVFIEVPIELSKEGHIAVRAERERIIAHWLGLPGMTQHRQSYFDTAVNRRLDKAIAKYGADDVMAAMTAYAEVLASPAHYFSHRWTLGDFLTRGLDRFVPEALPHETFLTRDGKKPGSMTVEEMLAEAHDARRQGR